MEHRRETSERRPVRALREILTRLRNDELAWAEQAGREQMAEAVTAPGDEVDLANSIAEREMCASLDRRHQGRLKVIDAAFERLRQRLYGICEQCGEEISLARLRVLPFATNCVDCQTERDTETRRTIGDNRWKSLVEMDEVLETESLVEDGEAVSDASIERAFGPDEEELKETRRKLRRRRPGQKASARASSIGRSVKGPRLHSVRVRRRG
jgi:RNA polymerase-binding transcription factor